MDGTFINGIREPAQLHILPRLRSNPSPSALTFRLPAGQGLDARGGALANSYARFCGLVV